MLSLHKECIDTLVGRIGEALRDVKVIHHNLLDYTSTSNILACEKILPTTGLREKLEDYIGGTPLYVFLFVTISKELSENHEYTEESAPKLLSEIEEYKDTNSVAKRLVEQFNSLPWEYTISIQLNESLKNLLTDFTTLAKFSQIINLVQPTPDFMKTYPLKSSIKRRDGQIGDVDYFSFFDNVEPWEQNSPCVQIITRGFIGWYGDTETVKNVISILKSFFGFCFALGILNVKTDSSYGEIPKKKRCYVHKKVGGKWEIETAFELPMELSGTINLLDINYSGKEHSDPELHDRIQRCFIIIVSLLNEQKKAKKLLLASEWLFDSYCGSNELLSFVQAIIVLEILLGDKSESDHIGLTALLRNRCAYLIGKSQLQRDEILKLFGKIYEVRSRIVHGGKTRLNSKEKELLRQLKWICRRAIAEEVLLFMADKKKITTEF